jgi:hypothetical protein
MIGQLQVRESFWTQWLQRFSDRIDLLDEMFDLIAECLFTIVMHRDNGIAFVTIKILIENSMFTNIKKLDDGEFHLLVVGETDSEHFGSGLQI